MRNSSAYFPNASPRFRRFLSATAVARRKRLLAVLIFVSLWCAPLFAAGPAVLIVVAHPDDESCFSATSYRIARELGGRVDEVVITNGEGGFRYSSLAEAYYDLDLTQQGSGRARLPDIRKQEMLKAGRVLGIGEFFFFGQPDQGFTEDIKEAVAGWDQELVSQRLKQNLTTTHYDFVFTLFPTNETHGHHKLAAMFALQAVASLPGKKPVVLGCQNTSAQTTAKLKWTVATGLPTVTLVNSTAFVFDRTRKFGFRDALDYQIIANWEIAEHKSQGLLQTDVNRYSREEFVMFDVSGTDSLGRARRLFEQLAPMSVTATGSGK